MRRPNCVSLVSTGGLVALALGAIFSLACAVELGDASTALPVDEEAETPANRTDCAEILGTAFRSQEERQWYEENCNQWPPVSVPQTPAQTAQRAAPEPPECAGIRGRPYQSDEQRRWYLSNCQGQQQGGSQAPPPPGQGDRSNCDEIRGTPYRSNGERDWFRQNCPSTPSGGTGPDRTDCNQIRGTSYRSAAERDWFLKNCPAGNQGASNNQGETRRVIIIGRDDEDD
jgi:hypothetical protein